MVGTTTQLRLEEIALDFQPADNLIEEKVEEYVDILRSGQSIAPVVVRFDGSRYLLQDGFHRLEAAKRADLETIEAEISSGTLAEMEAEFRQALEEIKRSLRQ